MANDVTCGVEGFGDAVLSMCAAHIADQTADMEKLITKAAMTSARELRDGPLTPAESGEYAKGFTARRTGGADGTIEYTVGNAGDRGWLTHLLEKGHHLFVHGRPTGKRTRAFPHIEPAYVVGSQILLNATVDG